MGKIQSKVLHLIICQTCHKRIKTGEQYTIWEDSIYCEPCFDAYLDLIEMKRIDIEMDILNNIDD